jgi:hypothetical protein
MGERHNDTFSMPLPPKRAETFDGFDQNGKEKGCVKKKSATYLTDVESATNEHPSMSALLVIAKQYSPSVRLITRQRQRELARLLSGIFDVISRLVIRISKNEFLITRLPAYLIYSII